MKLSVIFNLVLIGIIIIQKKKHIKENQINVLKENNILKEILSKVNNNELNFIDSSAKYIIEVLKKYYKIDYCTIFIKENDSMKVIASDIDIFYYDELIDHCNKLVKKKKGTAIISESEVTYLNYNSATKRRIKYSYYISIGDVGALYIENKNNYEENNFEIDFFNLIIKNINIILKNCIYQDKISKLAMKDNLTGIYNRNFMNENINKVVKSGSKVVFAIMDIDHFKSINDTYGHNYGDYVLITLSNFIKRQLSNNDEVYRWGGEEFVLTFVDQNIKDVIFKIELIRESISKLQLNDGAIASNVSVSFGIAAYGKEDTIDSVFRKADKALYSSKETGRNKVSVYKC